MVKWIVEAHQGTITVSSKLNEGTTFTCIFPSYTVRKEDDMPVRSIKIISWPSGSVHLDIFRWDQCASSAHALKLFGRNESEVTEQMKFYGRQAQRHFSA